LCLECFEKEWWELLDSEWIRNCRVDYIYNSYFI
jgi:hypothetical protein